MNSKSIGELRREYALSELERFKDDERDAYIIPYVEADDVVFSHIVSATTGDDDGGYTLFTGGLDVTGQSRSYILERNSSIGKASYDLDFWKPIIGIITLQKSLLLPIFTIPCYLYRSNVPLQGFVKYMIVYSAEEHYGGKAPVALGLRCTNDYQNLKYVEMNLKDYVP